MYNLQCSGKCCAKVCLILWEEPGQPKIANFRLEFVVKEDIAGFNISMNYP